MSDETEDVTLHLESYPPSAAEGILRTVGFGIGSDVKLLIEIRESDDGAEINLTLSGVENEDVPEFLETVADVLGVAKAGIAGSEDVGGES